MAVLKHIAVKNVNYGEGSRNIHTHIMINSVRKYDVEHKDFMEWPCDSRAGYKHHVTKKHLAFLKQSVMDICNHENLHQVALLSPARKKLLTLNTTLHSARTRKQPDTFLQAALQSQPYSKHRSNFSGTP